MTEAQLREAQEEAERKADKLLEMPPVLRAREPIDKVMEFDPLIQGRERSTLIFTDISMNVSDRVCYHFNNIKLCLTFKHEKHLNEFVHIFCTL